MKFHRLKWHSNARCVLRIQGFGEEAVFDDSHSILSTIKGEGGVVDDYQILEISKHWKLYFFKYRSFAFYCLSHSHDRENKEPNVNDICIIHIDRRYIDIYMCTKEPLD